MALVLTEIEDGIAIVTLNRPEAMNALSLRSGVSRRACSGSSASVRLMRSMRSMSTDKASRKMPDSACPAICARLG